MRRMMAAVLLSCCLLFISPYATAQKSSPQKPAQKTTQGSPTAKVWVNETSKTYHCPGARYYGRTKHGEYMTQKEAQDKGFRPARGQFCR